MNTNDILTALNSFIINPIILFMTTHDKVNYLQYNVYNERIQSNTIINTHILLPKDENDIQKHRHAYLKLYPSIKSKNMFYPAINDVMKLFDGNIKKIHPSGLNAFFPAFAGYFVHMFTHTWYNEDGIPYQNNSGGFLGTPIYGNTTRILFTNAQKR